MNEKAGNLSSDKMTLGQKLSFGVGEFGTTLIYSVIAYFLMVYYTDVAMISASAAGIIVMIGRISDGVTDPIMGIIADRTRTKWGRYRPYLLCFSLPFAISAVMCFSVPDWPAGWKVAYALVTYVITGVFYTTVDIPYWSMISAISQDPQERSELSAIKRFSNMFNNMIVTLLFLPLVGLLGKGNQGKGYQLVMIIFGFVGVLALWFTFSRTKEKKVDTEKKIKINLKDTIRTVTSNRPLLMVLITALFLSTTFNMKMSATIYYFNYNVGKGELISPFLGLAVLCVLGGIVISVPVSKAMGKRNACLLGMLVSNISYLGMFITGPKQVLLLFVWNFIGALALGMPLVIYIGMIADTVDYAEWKTGVRSDSFIFAMNTLMYKITAALGVAAIGFALSISGYVPNIAQTARSLTGINLMMTIVPCIGGIIAMIPMYFYNLDDKKLRAILTDLEERKQSKKEVIAP